MFFSCSENVPQLGPIAASSTSPHNLSLSWSTESGHFDGFVVRVSDSEHQTDTLEFRLSGEARNKTLTNLMDDTSYEIELYGISHGRYTSSVFTNAVTGTAYFTYCIFLDLYYIYIYIYILKCTKSKTDVHYDQLLFLEFAIKIIYTYSMGYSVSYVVTSNQYLISCDFSHSVG